MIIVWNHYYSPMVSVKRYFQPKLNFPIQSVSTSKNSDKSSSNSIYHSYDTSEIFKSDRKRRRETSPMYLSKKSKQINIPRYQIMVSLLDEDLPISLTFRCFHEDSIFPSSIWPCLVQSRDQDDDCQTLEQDISLCSDYISFQLEQAILKAEINA